MRLSKTLWNRPQTIRPSSRDQIQWAHVCGRHRCGHMCYYYFSFSTFQMPYCVYECHCSLCQCIPQSLFFYILKEIDMNNSVHLSLYRTFSIPIYDMSPLLTVHRPHIVSRTCYIQCSVTMSKNYLMEFFLFFLASCMYRTHFGGTAATLKNRKMWTWLVFYRNANVNEQRINFNCWRTLQCL